MYSKILVGVDGSENAYRALEQGTALAEKFGAQIIVVFVVHIPVSAYSYDAFGSMEIFSKLEQEGKEVLAKSELLCRQKGLAVKTALASGDPAQHIIDLAQSEGADLVVVGSRGTGRLERLLMGSVSERVARFAKCPVLVVK
jgi:nucleotide-binding universal stress UspA family protein